MQTDDKSISTEEKIKQLVEFEKEKRKELEQKKIDFEKKKKELEELETTRTKEISAAREELEEQIEELAVEEKKRFEELDEIRRKKEQEAASLEETIENEEGKVRAQEGQRQRGYGEVIEQILRGNPGVYDITNYNVMNRLERIAREANERPLDQTERNFVELVQYHAQRMQANAFYREKDTSEYMRRELEKIDQINIALKEREKPGNYAP
jgi:hypothetical protein